MRAVCWFGKQDVRVETVPDPKILNARDAIIKITTTAICGSDLHLYNGNIPTMQEGDILGHEFMGEVVEVGPSVQNLRPGDTVAVWGCGPVGQFAIKSAYILGAERVIAIDRRPERLQMAKEQGRAEVLNYQDVDVLDALRELTGGRGPDACIDAVGMEAHGTAIDAIYDRVKQAVML